MQESLLKTNRVHEEPWIGLPERIGIDGRKMDALKFTQAVHSASEKFGRPCIADRHSIRNGHIEEAFKNHRDGQVFPVSIQPRQEGKGNEDN